MAGIWKAVALVVAAALLGGCAEKESVLDRVGRPATEVTYEETGTSLKVGLPGARDEVNLVEMPGGSLGYLIERVGAGTDRILTAEEFSQLLSRSRGSRGWVAQLLNITSPVGFLWVSLGMLGQLIFTGRMLVQWIASERSKRSVIPVAFWWMSLGGAIMLTIYFVWRRDIVGVVGQGTGLFIYARNLMLIRRSHGG